MKNFFMKSIKGQSGIGLVEVIAALGITVVVLTSLLSLTLFSLRTSLQSTLLQEATKAANAQMELLRAYRDMQTNWGDFTSEVGTCTSAQKCYVNPNLSAIVQNSTFPTNSSGTQISTGFYVNIVNNVVSTTVVSSYSIGGQNKTTYVYTDLTNWQNKPE